MLPTYIINVTTTIMNSWQNPPIPRRMQLNGADVESTLPGKCSVNRSVKTKVTPKHIRLIHGRFNPAPSLPTDDWSTNIFFGICARLVEYISLRVFSCLIILLLFLQSLFTHDHFLRVFHCRWSSVLHWVQEKKNKVKNYFHSHENRWRGPQGIFENKSPYVVPVAK